MATKLYVGGLAENVSEEQLKTLFAEIGKVMTAFVIKDRDSGQSKGFGFVEMENKDDAETAIKNLNGKELDGKAIIVNEARPQENRR